VPEKREELTTEGGLDVLANREKVQQAVRRLQDRGIQVSLFIDPVREQIEASKEIGARAVEIHTGTYCNAAGSARQRELEAIGAAAALARHLGLEVHAGHGLDYHNVLSIARIAEIVELNIGHSIIARAVLVGIEQAVREMKRLLTKARE
jgi:pyridoxine 5-phosphate synthase